MLPVMSLKGLLHMFYSKQYAHIGRECLTRHFIYTYVGALDGGSPCRLSILRNANVACLCRLFMAMSHVEYKK